MVALRYGTVGQTAALRAQHLKISYNIVFHYHEILYSTLWIFKHQIDRINLGTCWSGDDLLNVSDLESEWLSMTFSYTQAPSYRKRGRVVDRGRLVVLVVVAMSGRNCNELQWMARFFILGGLGKVFLFNSVSLFCRGATTQTHITQRKRCRLFHTPLHFHILHGFILEDFS